MKLKNSLLKNQYIHPKSSTNEGSKSVNTFERFKNFKINSGSQSHSSPRSSQISSNDHQLRVLQMVDAKQNQSTEENASSVSVSLFAGSLSLSQNSKIELKNFGSKTGILSTGQAKLPLLSKQSTLSMPLVEYDSLHQAVQRTNSFQAPSPHEVRLATFNQLSDNFSQGSKKFTDLNTSKGVHR